MAAQALEGLLVVCGERNGTWFETGTSLIWFGPLPCVGMVVRALTSKQRRLKVAKLGWSRPPIPSTMAGDRRKGPRGTGLGSRPRMKPKSRWKKRPLGQSMMLCRCRSPMPGCIRERDI